jgi:metal-responsive CopG/Arc/MetJ family transcriptional regulator
MMMMYDMIYDILMKRCISMYMSLNKTEHMYTVTAKLYRMIYVIFQTKRINMPMSLNRTEHRYIITTGLHMMIYKASCLDVLV